MFKINLGTIRKLQEFIRRDSFRVTITARTENTIACENGLIHKSTKNDPSYILQ
jgi:hypothetical protein